MHCKMRQTTPKIEELTDDLVEDLDDLDPSDLPCLDDFYATE